MKQFVRFSLVLSSLILVQQGFTQEKPTLAQLSIDPPVVLIDGPRSPVQVLVTAHYSDQTVRDVTDLCKIDLQAAAGKATWENGWLRAQTNFEATAKISFENLTLPLQITAKNVTASENVSFSHELVATLNVAGCNMGACHGTPSGKNGFRLSLRGFDPADDYKQLTRDQFNRRLIVQQPEHSLIVQKGTGQVAHEGGARLGIDSFVTEVMKTWIAQGAPNDVTTAAPVTSLSVTPSKRVIYAPQSTQRVRVVAQFKDSRTQDVTRLCNFSSSDTNIADVDATGKVEFRSPGEVAILVRYLEEMQSVRITYLPPAKGFTWQAPPEANFVDQHVFAKLKQMTILPSELAGDSEFLRRVYLDVCGMLPPPEVVDQFLQDTSPDKRTKLVNNLFQRPEYADFWTLKWADVLRSNRKVIDVKGAYALQQWLREHFMKNTSFDLMVRELLTANGSSYRNPPANYYTITKDPTVLAENTAQVFMGIRMQCAKCHNHPFESITQDDYYSTAAWFARVKLRKDTSIPVKANNAQFIFSARAGEITQPRTGKVMAPKYLKGEVPPLDASASRREVYAKWLTDTNNPFFARSVVNRVWFHLFGKGIVDPVDDFRESNPPSNEELLNALAADFAKNKFDMQHLIRTIVLSTTYQLSAKPNATNADDSRYFSRSIPRPLTAEQLLDAICDLTGVPEKYAGLPAGTRAIQLPDGEVNHPFLKTFGQPARELACECERENEGNLAQALQLINGATINEKIRQPNNWLKAQVTAKKADTEIIQALYRRAFARNPNPQEVQLLTDFLKKSTNRDSAWEDVLWSILNMDEFLSNN
ncbi:MAG: DUF1553 domain-containing protein [Zavarzinella sp.]